MTLKVSSDENLFSELGRLKQCCHNFTNRYFFSISLTQDLTGDDKTKLIGWPKAEVFQGQTFGYSQK